MKILTIGQVCYDVVLPLDNFPVQNTKTKIYTKKELIGGSAFNAAKLLAKWDSDVSFVGLIGNDIYGEQIKKYSIKNNINISGLEARDDVNTPTSYILSDKNTGKRTIVTNRSVDVKLKKYNIDNDYDAIYSDGYEKDCFIYAIKENPNAIKIIDAGTFSDDSIEIAKLCDYMVCSKDFAEKYTKISIDYNDLKSIENVYEHLKRDFNNIIVITLEEKGCFTYYEGEYLLIPTIKVNPIDTSGAGDIFHGTFTYFLLNNYNFIDTLKYSNIVASLSTEKIGTDDIISKEELLFKYKDAIK